jgi:hypothetical protein
MTMTYFIGEVSAVASKRELLKQIDMTSWRTEAILLSVVQGG